MPKSTESATLSVAKDFLEEAIQIQLFHTDEYRLKHEAHFTSIMYDTIIRKKLICEGN